MSQTAAPTPPKSWVGRRFAEVREHDRAVQKEVRAKLEQEQTERKLRRTEKKHALHKRLRWTGNVRLGDGWKAEKFDGEIVGWAWTTPEKTVQHYDANYTLLSVDFPDKHRQTYDAQERIDELTRPNGEVLKHLYDEESHLTGIEIRKPGEKGFELWSPDLDHIRAKTWDDGTTAHFEQHRVRQVTYPYGVEEMYSAEGELVQRTLTIRALVAPGETKQYVSTTRYEHGQVLSISDQSERLVDGKLWTRTTHFDKGVPVRRDYDNGEDKSWTQDLTNGSIIDNFDQPVLTNDELEAQHNRAVSAIAQDAGGEGPERENVDWQHNQDNWVTGDEPITEAQEYTIQRFGLGIDTAGMSKSYASKIITAKEEGEDLTQFVSRRAATPADEIKVISTEDLSEEVTTQRSEADELFEGGVTYQDFDVAAYEDEESTVVRAEQQVEELVDQYERETEDQISDEELYEGLTGGDYDDLKDDMMEELLNRRPDLGGLGHLTPSEMLLYNYQNLKHRLSDDHAAGFDDDEEARERVETYRREYLETLKTESLIKAETSSLRELQNEVRRYQKYQGLSDEDLARRDIDEAMYRAYLGAKNSAGDPDKVREAMEPIQKLERDYELLTGPDQSLDERGLCKQDILDESVDNHEFDKEKLEAASTALVAKREALVTQAFDEMWMGSLNPNVSLSHHDLARVQEFRNRWKVTDLNSPLGNGEITDPEMKVEYTELWRDINQTPGKDLGPEQDR